MNDLVITNTLTMTSLEVAELTGKRHAHVLADVDKLLAALSLDSAEFSAQYTDSTGRSLRCFKLDKELTMTLVSGYDSVLRNKIVKRWLELEGRTIQPLSPLEILVKQSQMLLDQKLQLDDQGRRLTELEAKIDTSPTDFFVVKGYASLRGVRLDLSVATSLGRKAAKLSRESGYPIGEAPDPRFGRVNTYHIDILKTIFDQETTHGL